MGAWIKGLDVLLEVRVEDGRTRKKKKDHVQVFGGLPTASNLSKSG